MYCMQHGSKCPFNKPVTVVGLGYSLYDALATSFIHYDCTAFLTYQVVYTLKKGDDKKETDWTDKVDAVPSIQSIKHNTSEAQRGNSVSGLSLPPTAKPYWYLPCALVFTTGLPELICAVLGSGGVWKTTR